MHKYEGSGRLCFLASRMLHFVLRLQQQVLPWIICLGPIGLLFASSHDFVWPNLYAFPLKLGSIYINLQLKTRTSQNQAQSEKYRHKSQINAN